MEKEYKILLNKIREILLVDWDPIGIVDLVDEKNEYDTQANKLFSMYLENDISEERIREYLNFIAKEDLGTELNKERTENTVKKLYKFFKNDTRSQDKIIKNFLDMFPELAAHPLIKDDDFTDTPYFFCSAVRDILINSINETHPLANKISNWLSNTFNNPDTSASVHDMLWIQFFEGSEIDEPYKNYLLSSLKDKANLLYRQYLYIMENGGLTDPTTGEILKRELIGLTTIKTGKFITDIK